MRRPAAGAVDRFDAALLLSDISGFTALTERLQSRGREGAEEISAVISAAFAPAIASIRRHGGSIVSFGGDSLFTLFLGPSPVSQAVATADEIAASLARRGTVPTSAGDVTLGVSQAIHYGAVTGLHLGLPAARHYAVCGRAVSTLARMGSRAAGRILVSPAARARRHREAPPQPLAAATARASPARLGAYVPRLLLPLMGRFDGEYRDAAVLFLETRGARPAAVASFHAALGAALDRYGGVLLKTDLSPHGTKWLCAFGIPVAHEEDAGRAARAAAEVVGAASPRRGVRGAIHAGILVNVEIGSRTRRSFDVMGDVVNTAARALARAAWGEVLVTEPVRQRIRGMVTARRGLHEVKGKAAPLTLHAVLGFARTVTEGREAGPFVGRTAERARIASALHGARGGRGGALGIAGEAGMGKSRLVAVVADDARRLGLDVHTGRAVPFGSPPYGAVGELVRSVLGIRDDEPDRGGQRLREAAAAHGLAEVDRQHLADVVGISEPGSVLRHLEARVIRQNVMVAIRALLGAMARARPRLYVLEDMHWGDEMTLEAAAGLAADAGGEPYLLLLAHRPGIDLPPAVEVMALSPLPEDAAGELLSALAGDLPEAAARLVLERAGGNPFYVEEVLRHLEESGVLRPGAGGLRLARAPTAGDVPRRVETLIRSRLDALPLAAKSAAQHGSVLGRSFSPGLLSRIRAAARLPAGAGGVGELARRDIVRPVPDTAEGDVAFKHALTRDVAYGSLLVARRRRIHHAAATVLAAAEDPEGRSHAMLGHHWEQGGSPARARTCYLLAARAAASRFANAEAEAGFQAFLRVADEASPEAVAARHELGRLHKLVGRVKEAEAEHARAADTARRIGDLQGEAEGCYRIAVLRTLEDPGNEGLYARALAIWEELGDLASQARVLSSLGWIALARGNVREAREHYARGLAAARAAADRHMESMLLDHLSGVHQEEGDLDAALEVSTRALAIQRELGNPYHEGIVLGGIATIAHRRGQTEEAVRRYEEALALARRCGDRRRIGILLSNLAAMAHDGGDEATARRSLEEALATARLIGESSFQGSVLVNLAIVERGAGDLPRARLLLEQAIAMQARTGNRRAETAARAHLARVVGEVGKVEEGLVQAEDSLAAARALASPAAIAGVLEVLGDLWLQAGDPSRAALAWEEARALRHGLGERVKEGSLLARIAGMARFTGGSLEAAMASVARADDLVGASADPAERVRIACTAGHLALAAGGDGARELDEAERRLRSLGPSPPLASRTGVQGLQRAVASRRRGEALACGDCPRDVAAPLRRWLLRERGSDVPRAARDAWRQEGG